MPKQLEQRTSYRYPVLGAPTDPLLRAKTNTPLSQELLGIWQREEKRKDLEAPRSKIFSAFYSLTIHLITN